MTDPRCPTCHADYREDHYVMAQLGEGIIGECVDPWHESKECEWCSGRGGFCGCWPDRCKRPCEDCPDCDGTGTAK